MPSAKDEMSLGRMVTLLVADLHKDNVGLPLRNQEPWHLLFYRLKKALDMPDRPEFLDDLVFDWDGPYPKCDELSEFLNGLHISANVSAHNPSFGFISVDDDDAARWSEELGRLDPGVKTFVERATVFAREEFSSI